MPFRYLIEGSFRADFEKILKSQGSSVGRHLEVPDGGDIRDMEACFPMSVEDKCHAECEHTQYIVYI